jgi:hypothetical protein
MARTEKTGKARARKTRGRRIKKQPPTNSRHSGSIIKRRRIPISKARLERGLRVLAETKDIATASRAIRVSKENLESPIGDQETPRL